LTIEGGLKVRNPGLPEPVSRATQVSAARAGSQKPAPTTQKCDLSFDRLVKNGTMLRSRTGRVVDWGTFLGLKKDVNGIVTRNDYFQALGQSVPNREEWFRTIDKNNDGRFDFAEFSTGGHRTDPVGTFLGLDVDLNGKVSRTELVALPDGWRQMALIALRAFDDNADGELSLREYQLMPHSNLVASWSSAIDTNNDGMLSVDEFQFQKGVPLAAITREYFRRLDLDGNMRLTLDEWPFQTNHPEARFRLLDKDSNGSLTEAEFTAEGSQAKERLSRDFKLLDANHDERMDLREFFTLPYWIPDSQRGAIPDPIVMASDDQFKELAAHWGAWDRNGDDQLNAMEFGNAKIGQHVRGLESTEFRDWDRDRSGKVSREEVKHVLDMAFGIRTPEGKLLRSPSGRVVDWVLFRQLRLDRNGFVSRAVYFQALGSLSDTEKAKWFQGTDQNHDGQFNYDEFALSDHRTDPLATFLHLDADLNGRLTMNELRTLSPQYLPFVNYLFPGFDDDKDGALSLQEYQRTPMVNTLADWRAVQDADGDGRLSPEEFRFQPGVPLAALSAAYFRRFDKDKDNSLTADEFPFASDLWEICVMFADDTRKMIGIPGYAIVCSPEISPDAKWIAVDGWKSGQSNVTAHIFTVHVDTKEVRDLGIGCIPNWSADGRKIAFSRYGRGVFIRNFEGMPVREESIDPQGWAIQFSPDGLKTAYVKGGNLVVHTLKTGEKKFVFPEGQSPYNYIEHNFTWSPDSGRLCFKGHRGNGVIDIGIVAASGKPNLRIRCDGRNVRQYAGWNAPLLQESGQPAGEDAHLRSARRAGEDVLRVWRAAA
jgi:Ca2+-binding EF-hand superfamily protein